MESLFQEFAFALIPVERQKVRRFSGAGEVALALSGYQQFFSGPVVFFQNDPFEAFHENGSHEPRRSRAGYYAVVLFHLPIIQKGEGIVKRGMGFSQRSQRINFSEI